MATLYFAKWVWPGDAPPIENGVVSVTDTIIDDVGTRSRVRRKSGDRIVNLGNVLLLPGFINIHTHLEERVLKGTRWDADETFASKFAKKNNRLKNVPPKEITASVRLAVREMLFHGITTISDSSRTGISASVLADEPVRSWIFHELHTDTHATEPTLFSELEQGCRTFDNKHLRQGISPHALFSL